MTAIKARIGGAWVDTTKVGKARIGGAWVDFGPASGSEVVNWGTSPAFTDLVDGTQSYNMGIAFSLVTGKNALGVQWRVPDSTPNPAGGVHAVGIYVDGGSRIAYKEFVPVPGGNQNVLFDTPVALSSGVTYVAGVYTLHYVFRSGSPAGLTSPSGNIVVDAGRLRTDNGGAAGSGYPDGTFNATYYISPIVAT
jgi:hypothetical protein